MKEQLITMIKNHLIKEFEVELSKKDVTNIYYVLGGIHHFDVNEMIKYGNISYAIETYFDNKE